jgi:CHAT domain-containing protein/Flp pilus assembly protein TadD
VPNTIRRAWLLAWMAAVGVLAPAAPTLGQPRAVVPDDYRGVLERRSRGWATSTASEALEAVDAGNLDDAEQKLERLADTFRKSQETLKQASAVDLQGLVYQRQGKLGLAVLRHRSALKLLDGVSSDGAQEARWNALTNLAVVQYLQGDYADAEQALTEVIGAVEKSGDPLTDGQRLILGRALNNRGLVQHELGRASRARGDFDDAQGKAGTSAAGKRLQAEALNNYGRFYGFEGRVADARAKLAQARALAQDLADPVLEANILDSLAEVLLQREPRDDETRRLWGEALKALDEARTLEARAGAQAIRVSILKNRGRALVGLGRAPEGLASLDEAARLAANARAHGLRRAVLRARGDAHASLGQLDAAIADYKVAVDLVESTRVRLVRESEREFLRSVQKLYEGLLEALLRKGDVTGALAYLDRSKGFVLSHELQKRHPELADAVAERQIEGAQGLLKQEEALDRRLQDALNQGPAGEATARKLGEQLAQIRKDVAVAVEDLKRRYGDRYSQYFTVNPLSLKDFASQLPAGHLLVTFFAADDALAVFTVSRETGVSWRRSPGVTRASLDARVQRYRQLVAQAPRMDTNLTIASWGDAKWTELRTLTDDLYRTLLGPIEAEVRQARHVILAPTGLLYYLPFHALGPYDKTSRELRPLLLDRPVSYVTSASVLKVAVGATPPRRPLLLAFGNPRYEHETPKLAQLPHAEDEVKALGALFGDRGVARYGESATRTELVAQLGAPGAPSRFGFLHLATHGILDSRSPVDSWLALDGKNRLAARELPRLLEGRELSLVTLSACETGRGEDKPGTDVMSLADFVNGASVPSVVVTLWEVADEATKVLMVRFYETLLQQPTLDKAAALRTAQLSLATRPEMRHPFFWAPFILIGDWR